MVTIQATPPNEYRAWLHVAALILPKALVIYAVASPGISRPFYFSFSTDHKECLLGPASLISSAQPSCTFHTLEVLPRDPIHNQLRLWEWLWSRGCVENWTCPSTDDVLRVRGRGRFNETETFPESDIWQGDICVLFGMVRIHVALSVLG